MNRWELIERYWKMKELEDSGLSSREIGLQFGISGARVRFVLDHPISDRRYTRITNNPKYKYATRENYRIEILNLLGNKCSRCGYDSDIRALQIDHVNGGGRDDRREHGGSMYIRIYEQLKDGSKEYQVLCANCNWIKRMENKEHKKSKRYNEKH